MQVYTTCKRGTSGFGYGVLGCQGKSARAEVARKHRRISFRPCTGFRHQARAARDLSEDAPRFPPVRAPQSADEQAQDQQVLQLAQQATAHANAVHEPSVHAVAARAAAPPRPAAVSASTTPASPPTVFFLLGAAAASLLHSGMQVLLDTPRSDSKSRRSLASIDDDMIAPDPWGPDVPPLPPRPVPATMSASHDIVPDAESVEWVNMCIRKIWRVYQRGLETWIQGLLQPVFDTYINEDTQPAILKRIRIAQFTLNHEPPVFNNMQRRNSRKESDINGVFMVRYSGGAKMLLVLELGGKLDGIEIPVMVEDFDLDSKIWIKLRLAPMAPWIGVVSFAFVEPPRIQAQLNPYGRLPLMRIPILQNFLRKLLTVDLPSVMVLPQRLEINLPPSVTVLAEAAVGRDTVMRAVASAVLQADALEQALVCALPMDAENVVTRVAVPEAFVGELSVTLMRGRDLPVWGFPWQSNPFCRLELGSQAVESKRERETGGRGTFKFPVWNQEFQFLVEDPSTQQLRITVYDSPYTGRAEVCTCTLRLSDLPQDGTMKVWIPVKTDGDSGSADRQSALRLHVSYRAFDDLDGSDSGSRLAAGEEEAIVVKGGNGALPITDVQSAAAASSQQAVESSRALEALSVAKAAAARAAARLSAPALSASLDAASRARRGGDDSDTGSDSDGEYVAGGAMVPLAQLVELERVREDREYMQQLVDASGRKALSRQEQEELLADTLSKRAVTRITDKETPPALFSRDMVVKQALVKDGPPVPPSRRPNLDVDYALAQGDGSTRSLEDLDGGRLAVLSQQSGEFALLPKSLPNASGDAIDELIARGQPTTRIVDSTDEEASAVKSPGSSIAADLATGLVSDAATQTASANGSTNGITDDTAAQVRQRAAQVREQGVQTGRGDSAAVPSSSGAKDGGDDLLNVQRTMDLDIASGFITSSTTQPVPAKMDRAPSTASTGLLQEVEQLHTAQGGSSSEDEGPASPSKRNGAPNSGAGTRSSAGLAAKEGATAQAVRESTKADASTNTSTPWWMFWDQSGANTEAVSKNTHVKNKDTGDTVGVSDAVTQTSGDDRDFFKWFGSLQWPGSLNTGKPTEEKAAKDKKEKAAGDDASMKKAATGPPPDASVSGDGGVGGAFREWWTTTIDSATKAISGSGKGRGEVVRQEDGAVAEGGRKNTRKPVETIIVSPEVPIEEIAAEIARVKAQQSSETEEKTRKEVEALLAGPVRRLRNLGEQLNNLNKPEVVLLCALSGGVMVLLAVVAYRLELWVEYKKIVEQLQQAGLLDLLSVPLDR